MTAAWILLGIAAAVLIAGVLAGAFMWGQFLQRVDEERARRIDVTTVPPGALDRMRREPARPSAQLAEAIERRRQRR
jgi:hypothetical protein